MAVVALLLSEAIEIPDLAPDKVEAFLRPYGQLIERLRAERPEDGSDDECEIVLEAISLSRGLQRELESQWVGVLRDDLDRRLREIVEAELSSADAERKLAIRFLEQSLETMGELIEWIAKLWESFSVSGAFSEMFGWFDERVVEVGLALDPQSLELFRWQLDVIVGLRCLQAAPDELAWWARRCAIGRRRVSALLASPELRGWRGDIARHKARTSWARWDDEELERELAPWPQK